MRVIYILKIISVLIEIYNTKILFKSGIIKTIKEHAKETNKRHNKAKFKFLFNFDSCFNLTQNDKQIIIDALELI